MKQNPIKLVQSASGRRLGPYRALVQKLEDLPQGDSWKIPDELSESDSDSGESESESGESSDSDKNEPSPGTSGTSGNGFIGFSVASLPMKEWILMNSTNIYFGKLIFCILLWPSSIKLLIREKFCVISYYFLSKVCFC